MTPEAVETKYGVPPHRYPELAALVGEDSDNLPGVPGRRPEDGREVDQPVRRPRQRDHPRRRDQGQGGREPARPPRRRDPQPPAQRAWCVDLDAARRARRPGAAGRGTATRCTRSSTASSSGCCATGSSRRWSPRRTIDDSGFELAGERLASGDVAAWLAEHAATGADAGRTGVAVQGAWRAGTGEVWSVALAAADGTAAWFDAAELTPEDGRAPSRRGSPTPARPRCCTTPRARCWRWPPGAGRWPGWSATPRSRRTSCAPTSAPTTWPT